MAKKPISQKRAEKEELENRALHRVFNVFLLGLAAECYLFLVYRGYAAGTIDSMLVWHQILTWGMYAGLVMLVAGAAVAFAKRQDARLRTGMLWLGGIGLFLALSGWVVTFFFDNNRGITTMCIDFGGAGPDFLPVPAGVFPEHVGAQLRDVHRMAAGRVGGLIPHGRSSDCWRGAGCGPLGRCGCADPQGPGG